MDKLHPAPQPRSNKWRIPKFHFDPKCKAYKLFLAIIAHDVEAVREELTSGANPNQIFGAPDHLTGCLLTYRLYENELPLLIACELGDPAIVELLLQYKADPNKRHCVEDLDALSTMCNLTGDSGIEIYKEHLECADLLVKYGADINSTDECKRTALMAATDTENEAFVEWLLKHGADAMEEKGCVALKDDSWLKR